MSALSSPTLLSPATAAREGGQASRGSGQVRAATERPGTRRLPCPKRREPSGVRGPAELLGEQSVEVMDRHLAAHAEPARFVGLAAQSALYVLTNAHVL